MSVQFLPIDMNRDFTKPLDDLFVARLDVLLKTINDFYSTGRMITETDLLFLYNKAINIFYESLYKSITGSTISILPGSPPDPNIWNELITAIQQDLTTVYNEIAVLDKSISANFNSISIQREETLQTSKRIADKLGDYLLYSDPSLGAGFFFSDDFSTKDKLDLSSNLIDKDICFHDTNEGVILLPIDGDPTRPTIQEIIINAPSNGTPGNNYQIGIYGHDAIETLSDNKANTWFEYEKVTTKDLSTPLILDITFVLSEISIINHININPLFFGTPSPVKVKTIETSRDGIDFLSIKDEIPIKDFVPVDEENTFSLSAASSNFSGQGSYSFLPRKAKYIHIVFEQYSPYGIETINGNRLRYAIGIRDINILSRKFKSSGSVISTLFNISNDIRKVSLWASENPTEPSVLADITHFISHDDGGTWLPIQPQNRIESSIPEVINFNTIAENSINTNEAIMSLRHKISMVRNVDNFTGEYFLKSEEIPKLDVTNIPGPASPEIILSEKPIKESVVVLIPYLGSFSCPRDRYGSNIAEKSVPMDLDFVEFLVDAPGAINTIDPAGNSQQEGTLRYKLPYTNIPYLSEKIRVFINGAQIEYMPQDSYLIENPSENPVSTQVIDSNSRIYFLNKEGTELQFGWKYHKESGDYQGYYQKGFIPSAGSKIQVCLDGDNPQVELTDNGFILKLSAPTDGNKETVSLIALETLEEDSASQYEIEIPAGSTEFQIPLMKESGIGEYLSSENTNESYKIPLFLGGTDNFFIKEYDLDGDLITGSSRQFTDAEEYVNGRFELRTILGDELVNSYSFDHETGTIYLGIAALNTRKTVFVGKKIEAKKISNNKWDFDVSPSTGVINPQNILLDPSVVYTTKQSTTITLSSSGQNGKQLISDNTRSHSWYNKKIIKGTVHPDLSLFNDNILPVEVPFIDGRKEFSNIVEIKDEPITFTSLGSNKYSFILQQADSNKIFIGPPTFAPVRSVDSVTSPVNLFSISGQVDSSTTVFTEGQWYVTINTDSTITITLYTTSIPGSHTVSYKLNDTTTGLDTNSLYSIDYFNGIIYFANPINATGNIVYEVSQYSAFYNIGKVINKSDIELIDEDNKTIKFNPAFALKFLKQNTIDRSRPQILKVLYNYYKRTSESLADLEPYFSPICKHLGIRAVTSNILEEL